MKDLQIKQIYIIILLGLLSSCLSFIFSQISPLISEGTSYPPALVTQIISIILIVSGMTQIHIGRLFDHDKGVLALALSLFLYLVGLLLLLSTKDVITILGACFALTGLGGIGLSHLRLTKLASGKENIDKIGHDDYLANNVGFSIAAVIAYFFIKDYLETLIYLDILTTFIAVVGYYYFYKKLLANGKGGTSESFQMQKREKIQYRKIWKKLVGASSFFPCLMFHISILPNIYTTLKLDTFKYQSATCFINGVVVMLMGSFLSKNLNFFSKYKRFL